MAILFNILSALSIIGIIIAGLCGDAADGCCGAPGTITDEQERKIAEHIRDYIGVPSIILFMFVLFSHWHFGVMLFGLF